MKYRKEVQQHATFPPTSFMLRSTADIGGADEVTSCLVTLGEVRGIIKCNYSKQFGKLLSYDRHRFRLCSGVSHQEAHRADPL